MRWRATTGRRWGPAAGRLADVLWVHHALDYAAAVGWRAALYRIAFAVSWQVEIKRMRYPGMAECETCNGLHPDSTRERCRQHADQFPGHHVRYVVEEVTFYERSGDTANCENRTP
jgi:hypothetical protein